jgi:hypothetical protein
VSGARAVVAEKGSGPITGDGKVVVCVDCKGLNFQPSQFSSLVG